MYPSHGKLLLLANTLNPEQAEKNNGDEVRVEVFDPGDFKDEESCIQYAQMDFSCAL